MKIGIPDRFPTTRSRSTSLRSDSATTCEAKPNQSTYPDLPGLDVEPRPRVAEREELPDLSGKRVRALLAKTGLVAPLNCFELEEGSWLGHDLRVLIEHAPADREELGAVAEVDCLPAAGRIEINSPHCARILVQQQRAGGWESCWTWHPASLEGGVGVVRKLPDGVWRVFFSGDGFYASDWTIVTVTQDVPVRVDVPVVVGRRVTGRAVDPNGRPVEGVRLGLEIDGEWLENRTETTGIDGSFLLEHTPPRPFELELTRRGFVTARIPVAAGGDVGVIVLARLEDR